jgi:hypothetical protein
MAQVFQGGGVEASSRPRYRETPERPTGPSQAMAVTAERAHPKTVEGLKVVLRACCRGQDVSLLRSKRPGKDSEINSKTEGVDWDHQLARSVAPSTQPMTEFDPKVTRLRCGQTPTRFFVVL